MPKASAPSRKAVPKPSAPKKSATAKKPAPVGDVTRTARSARHLVRLAEAKGRRVVVDMPAPVCDALDGLLANGYEANQKAVVCKALLEISKRQQKKA